MSWAPKPLSEILDQSGRHRAGDQDLPVLSITMKHGLVDQAAKFKKRIASSDTSNYRIAYKNELVVGFPIDEGVLGFQTKYPAGIVSPAYDIWRLKNEADCHIPYLERYLRSPHARSLYASRMQGAVARRRSLTRTDFLNLEVPFPPLDDQIRMAHLLGKVERLVAQRKQHLQQLDDLLRVVFREMFGDVALNTNAWKIDSLSNLGKFKNGLNFGVGDTGVRLRCLGVGDFKALSKIVNTDSLSTINLNQAPSEDYFLQSGDLVFVRSNGSKDLVGRCIAVYPNEEKVTYSGFCIRLRLKPNTLDPTYLVHLFRSPAFRRLMLQGGQGANIQNINQKSLSDLPIPVPPPALQEEFSKFVEKVEDVSAVYQQSLSDLEALYGALSQKAFKGELDLSRVSLPTEITPPMSTNTSMPIAEVVTPSELAGQSEQLAEPLTHDELLARWFRQYLANTPTTTVLRAAEMLEGAWQALQTAQLEVEVSGEEEEEDEEAPPDLADYDVLKALVFKALNAGELLQTFDDERNRVTLKRQSAEWGTW